MPQLWTLSQRRVILGMVVGMLGFLAVEYRINPVIVEDPQQPDSPRQNEVQNRIDPNTADAAALSAITNIGEKRAAEIVAYRREFLLAHPNRVAFSEPNDLMNIKGFGPGITASVEPYLVFPSRMPTTASSPIIAPDE